MTTAIRPLTILFSLLMLAFFGIVPYVLLVRIQPFEVNVSTITALAMLLLFLSGIFCVIWLTLFINIDKQMQTITFNYPFRFYKKKYNFNEIIGFRFKYLNAQINYKALQYKLSDGNTYTVSDFETVNLRELEKVSLENFDLRVGKSFDKLNQENKIYEISNSKQFDVKQAKDIRFYLGMGIIIFIVFAYFVVSKEMKNGDTISTVQVIILLTMLLIEVAMIKKLIRINRVLKNGI